MFVVYSPFHVNETRSALRKERKIEAFFTLSSSLSAGVFCCVSSRKWYSGHTPAYGFPYLFLLAVKLIPLVVFLPRTDFPENLTAWCRFLLSFCPRRTTTESTTADADQQRWRDESGLKFVCARESSSSLGFMMVIECGATVPFYCLNASQMSQRDIHSCRVLNN